MLIEAKARDSKPGSERESRFNFADVEKKTRLPVWIALALAGAFAYFKGFSGDTGSHAAQGDAQPPAVAAHHQSKIAAPPAIEAGPIDIDNAPRQTHDTQSSASYWDDGLLLDDQLISFEASPRPPSPQFESVFSGAPGWLASNDNRALASAAGAAIQPIAWRNNAAWDLPAETDDAQVHAGAAAIASGTHRTDKPSEATPSGSQTNRSPTVKGPVRLNDVFAGQAMLLTLGDLLLGARDADGDELHVIGLHASNGQVVQVGEAWAYTSNASNEGPVTLSYDVGDGVARVHQTAVFSVVEPPAEVDTHAGTSSDSGIVAANGNDVVAASVGADTVQGGAGDGRIDGSGGGNALSGGAGDDIIFGGLGADLIAGGAGNDELHGGAGDDTITGDDGDDVIFGDAGNDILDGGAGTDSLSGGDGNDVIAGGAGNDHIDGGAGADTLDLSVSAVAVAVDLDAGTASGDETGNDSITGIEFVIGGSGADTFVIGDDAVCITGGSGDDLYDVAPAPGPDDSPVTTAPERDLEIVDFAVGDRLKIGLYDVWERPSSDAAPQFDSVYAGTDADAGPPIATRDDHLGDLDVTVVEADLDRDDAYEIVVSLRGHHDLAITPHPIA